MLTRVSGAANIVDIEEVRRALNVIGDDPDEASLLNRLIEAATISLDGANGRLGRCLSPQVWRLDLDAFPAGVIQLPLPPLQSVEEFGYVDTSGEGQFYLDYNVVGIGSNDGGYLTPIGRWPSGTSVSIEFTCGFTQAPEDIRDALIAIVGSRYAWRESQVMSQSSLSAMPEVEDAIERWRTRGFG